MLFRNLKNWFKRQMLPIPYDVVNHQLFFFKPTLVVDKDSLRHIKEFQDMIGTPHSRRYHKEGDPWNHTMKVADCMKKFINEKNEFNLYGVDFRVENYDKETLMYAALCHDLGKPSTTYFDDEAKDYRCRNHGAVGEKITRELLFSMDIRKREEICWLVRYHMVFHHILEKEKDEQIQKMLELSKGHSTIEKLLLLCICDALSSDDGSKPAKRDKVLGENVRKIHELAENLHVWNTAQVGTKEKDPYTAVFLIGVPGSGKSSIANEYGKNIICRDTIREEVKDGNVIGRKLMLDKDGESKVTTQVNARIKKCCEDKETFVIDQTNMTKKGRRILLETIHKYGNPLILYVYVEGPSLEVCINRRGGGKWNSIVSKMWESLCFPDFNECDALEYIRT